MPPKSLVWQFFAMTEDKGKVKCQECGIIIISRGSTSPLTQHLVMRHGRVYEAAKAEKAAAEEAAAVAAHYAKKGQFRHNL